MKRKLVDECVLYPETAQKYFKQYFEKDTKTLYDFYNLDLREIRVFRNSCGGLAGVGMELKIPDRLQALNKNTHGGCLSFIFDAVMGVGLGFPRLMPVNAIMQTREIIKIEIFKPVPTDETIVIVAEIVKEVEERKFWVNSKIQNRQGELLAVAAGFFLRVEIEKLLT
jgi:acyl-coenzyme A thioesterase PaaI-like protein